MLDPRLARLTITLSTDEWVLPPADLALSNDDVHVWRVWLDLAVSSVRHLRFTLAPDELRRADRYHFETDRRRFIIARGVLRAILSRYLHQAPGQLQFGSNPYGKPTLLHPSAPDRLRFNVSHSDGLALIAIAAGREVGVDLERVRVDFACERIAEQFFSPREITALRALPAALRREALFTCWTRKEAYIKARGEGLSLPLDRFDVSLAPDLPAALLDVEGDPHEASRWSLRALHPGAGYVAALAVEGRGWNLRRWQWATTAGVDVGWRPIPATDLREASISL